jgi:hypothetical protein
VGGVCGTYGENQKKGDKLEEQGIDGLNILKFFLKKYDGSGPD